MLFCSRMLKLISMVFNGTKAHSKEDAKKELLGSGLIKEIIPDLAACLPSFQNLKKFLRSQRLGPDPQIDILKPAPCLSGKAFLFTAYSGYGSKGYP